MTAAENTFNKILKLITSSRFNEAFMLLKREFQKYPAISKELEYLKDSESTYRHMLAFLAAGHDDPSRKDMTNQIRESLYRANETILREARLTDSSDVYSSTRRLINLRKENLDLKLQNFKKCFNEDSGFSYDQNNALNEIFNYIWTMRDEKTEVYEEIESILTDDSWPDYLKSIVVSAIVLGNLSYFNPDAFELLIQCYNIVESIDVKARILVGLLLISLIYANRIEGNLNLKSRLMLIKEDEEWNRFMNDIILSIIRTYDTKRIDDKMRNEVIPGLMKIKPEIIDKMRNMASDAENFLSEANPHWEEMLENTDIGKNLQEISDMQLEGADVMVTAFSQLKNFPFFNSISNWFIPFIPSHHELSALQIENDEDTINRLTSVMCESDLYSFLLSLNQMPDANRSQMFSNIEAQMKEAQEALSDAIGETYEKTLKKKTVHFLQDLYRFFKFYKKKNEFKDPFETPFLASHIEKIIHLFGIKPDNIRLVAEFYFKNRYYEEASGMFELVDQLQPGDFNIWEKIGYSYDRSRRHDLAVEWYQKAEIVNPDSAWLEKKLAVALKNSGKNKEALRYYNRVLKREPENYHLLMSLAQCLIDSDNIDEALVHLYHAQYLKPEKLDVLRALAWVNLMAQNLDKANELYLKVRLHPESDSTDFLNAAHCLLANGNFKDALKNYRTFVEKSPGQDITNLVLAFRDDSEIIKKLGIKTSDLRLIVDKIRYDILKS